MDFVSCLSLALSLFASEPPNYIQLPTVPEPTPAPAPAPVPPAPPNQVKSLPSDCFYVVTSDTEFMVAGSPAGVVKVSKVRGPITLMGKFAEQPGAVQVKTFPQKFVSVVTAQSSGKCELLIWPVGAADDAAIIRRPLDVGQLPQPPPVDPPQPPPVEDPLVTSLKAAIKADNAGRDTVLKYASLWKVAADSTVQDAGITTSTALLKEMNDAAQKLNLPAHSLDKTAHAVADELNKSLSKIITLDAASRAKIAEAFKKVAKALEGAV